MAEPRTLLVYSAPAPDPWMDFLPIGLGYLQATLKARGYPCRIANLTGRSAKAVKAYLARQAPDLLGISMFTFNRHRSLELAALGREACPGALVVAGGPHPTHAPEAVLGAGPALDAVVRGEGEAPLLALVQALEAGRAWAEVPGVTTRTGANPAGPPAEDLDALGIPARHLEIDFLADPAQLGYLSTSRGCPARCAFCSTPEFWGQRMRFRSPASVLEEMRLLQARHGLTYYSFRDDTFTARKGRILELSGGIRASGLHPLWNCQSRVNLVDEERLVALKRAGCEFIQFGVEHGSPRMLRLLDKGADPAQVRRALAQVRRVGLNLGIYLITGIPGETQADLQASLDLVAETRPHDVQVAPLALYPGTRLYREALAAGTVPADFLEGRDLEVLARPGPFTDGAVARLRKAAERARPRARYTPAEFAEHKRLLGWCAVTNLLCGEAAEEAGRLEEAEAEYAEIIAREPGSTWGFLKRALLRARTGRRGAAREDLREVLRLVPHALEARSLAGELGLD